MAIEVEVKAYAKDLRSIEERLVSLGAKLVWEGEQVDTYYNHPSRDFSTTDEAVRIREVEGGSELTYKGPKTDSMSKTREEIKSRVEEGDQMKVLLDKLGFRQVAVVGKHRKKYSLGELNVCLDDVFGLGEFVEIESPLSDEEDEDKIQALRDDILKFLEQLGLEKTERRSYLELLYPELNETE